MLFRQKSFSMQTESDLLSYVEEDHVSLSQNKVNVEEQIDVLVTTQNILIEY